MRHTLDTVYGTLQVNAVLVTSKSFPGSRVPEQSRPCEAKVNARKKLERLARHNVGQVEGTC